MEINTLLNPMLLILIYNVFCVQLAARDRNVNDVRVYIQEYPQYGTSQPNGSYIDLNGAFYNEDPYTGIREDEIVVPSGLSW